MGRQLEDLAGITVDACGGAVDAIRAYRYLGGGRVLRDFEQKTDQQASFVLRLYNRHQRMTRRHKPQMPDASIGTPRA